MCENDRVSKKTAYTGFEDVRELYRVSRTHHSHLIKSSHAPSTIDISIRCRKSALREKKFNEHLSNTNNNN
jgi:hypothetical protein